MATGGFKRFLWKVVMLVVLLAVVFGAGWATGRLGLGTSVPVESLPDLERAFVERMHGAALVGFFTVAGREDQRTNPDRYDISSVEKVTEDVWRFNTRVRYANVDATLPITVTMRWVGDTPMITITDLEIPTLGTFTARVFFYGDRYAGTWEHAGRAGGHMFGRIETGAAEADPF